jgi:vacuolar-type H+-ATPase subunit H
LYQASDDAKRMVEEARTVAHTEIEAARASARRMEEALEEKEKFHGVLSQQVWLM